jgi:predicted Zn-dependent peptidase
MRHDRATLENGLEIVGERNPNAKSMALGFFVRTGARDETPEISGVSHFLEHMIFKGSARRSAEEVNLFFDEIGARYNAFTSDENTVYHGAVLPERQGDLLDLYGDLMRPALRQEDFDMEKNVILEEIARAYDSPATILYYLTRRLYYGDNPLSNPTLGSVETIRALERDQMRRYMESRYAPNNIKLVLSGNYDWEAAVEQARGLTREWTPQESPRVTIPPRPEAKVHIETTDKFQRAHLYWMAPGYAEQDPRRYAAAIAAFAIGARRGSRLYWALIEPGIVDAATFGHSGDDGVGVFIGYLSCDPARTQEVADIFRSVLDEAAGRGLTETEINGAKKKMAAAQVLHDETPMGRLLSVGMDWVYRREFATADEEADRIFAVTLDEANAALRELPRHQATLTGLGPFDQLH